MTEPRLKNRSYLCAPRALAVISCALALLAAQPMASASGSGLHKSRAIVLKDGSATGTGESSRALSQAPTIAQDRAIRATQVSGGALFESARRLHILATVEILQRLLMREFQPVQHDALAGLWFDSECAGITLPQAQSPQRTTRPDEPDRALPKIERAFAIAHQLLAPPLS